jgi:ribosomal protein S18 acetylase RimI-like enzyme
MAKIVVYNDVEHRDEVIRLWAAVFAYATPHNAPRLVIEKKLGARDNLFFVALIGHAVVGTAMAGYDGHRGWLYSVAVDPVHRGNGIGTDLVRQAERALVSMGCMKINLQIADGNEGVSSFYESLGYSIERRVSMGKVLHDNASDS